MVEVIFWLAPILPNSAFTLSVNTWYVQCTASSITLLHGEGLSLSIGLLVSISLIALLANSLMWPDH